MTEPDATAPDQQLADSDDAPTPGSLAAGVACVRAYLKTLPAGPGVYRMIDAKSEVLYVGKARDLRQRVTSYTQPNRLTARLVRMIAATGAMEFVVTGSEAEALLLENNLIKQYRPRYNVLLKDDKSFPYIKIRTDHAWPQLSKHRGVRDPDGEYFGPFASAGAVNRTLYALQRAFPLRSCSDAIFANRTRPCLQYQIKRCTAPCVGRIGPEDYSELVGEVRDFLAGRSRQVQEALSRQMEQASAALDFEAAAVFRDRIKALTQIQSHQSVFTLDIDDADVFAVHSQGGHSCVQVFFVRGGQNLGNKAYFPSRGRDLADADILSSAIGQFYAARPVPALILASHQPTERDLLQQALTLSAGHKVTIQKPARGRRRDAVEHAEANAREALARRLAESATQRQLLEGVARIFDLEQPPQRIEVYDNSHIQGADAVGAMIVAGPEGFTKNSYRKFNIREAAPDDDYAMMREVLTRRFARALKEDPERQSGQWPDLLLIDGGQGQLTQAMEVMAELGVSDIPVVGVAKGPDRDAGRERFFMPGRAPIRLEPRDPVLYYLQRLRDEAHRFAIGTHRAKRSKGIVGSALDEVAGVGPQRKRALLNHFGSVRGISAAGLADLEAVEGVSRAMAKKIYDHFHSGS